MNASFAIAIDNGSSGLSRRPCVERKAFASDPEVHSFGPRVVLLGSKSIHYGAGGGFRNHGSGKAGPVFGRNLGVLHPDLLSRHRNSVLVAHSTIDPILVLALAGRVRELYCLLSDASPTNRVALAARSRLAVCNFSEFAEMASAVGIACEGDAASVNLEIVATAMRAFLARVPGGDLVVTVGARGLIAAKGGGILVAHAALRYRPAQRERLCRSRPHSIPMRSVDGRFFSALAAAFAEAEDLFSAVRQALLVTANEFAKSLRIDAAQCDLRLFAA